MQILFIYLTLILIVYIIINLRKNFKCLLIHPKISFSLSSTFLLVPSELIECYDFNSLIHHLFLITLNIIIDYFSLINDLINEIFKINFGRFFMEGQELIAIPVENSSNNLDSFSNQNILSNDFNDSSKKERDKNGKSWFEILIKNPLEYIGSKLGFWKETSPVVEANNTLNSNIHNSTSNQFPNEENQNWFSYLFISPFEYILQKLGLISNDNFEVIPVEELSTVFVEESEESLVEVIPVEGTTSLIFSQEITLQTSPEAIAIRDSFISSYPGGFLNEMDWNHLSLNDSSETVMSTVFNTLHEYNRLLELRMKQVLEHRQLQEKSLETLIDEQAFIKFKEAITIFYEKDIACMEYFLDIVETLLKFSDELIPGKNISLEEYINMIHEGMDGLVELDNFRSQYLYQLNRKMDNMFN